MSKYDREKLGSGVVEKFSRKPDHVGNFMVIAITLALLSLAAMVANHIGLTDAFIQSFA